MSDPKTLIFDIETSPLLAYVWGLKDQNIGLNQIKDDWRVMAWAAKWLDNEYVWYADTRHDKSDKRIIQKLWHFLNEADIVITQNGKNFDSRKLNARFIEYGMNPPSPYEHLDTYKIADKVAEFTSHKLEYLTDKLNKKYKKLTHKNFPGMELWKECLKGNIKAWEEMKRYNIHDVLSTEELYLNLKAWAPETAPKPFAVENKNKDCPVCGAIASVINNGTRQCKTRKYQRLLCTKCGTWSKGDLIK